MKGKKFKACLRPADIRELLVVLGLCLLLGGQVAAQSPHTDIVADNLDRVAATAEQILEVLGQDAGLMVEMKRVIAQGAGAGGQLPEESNLSDAAVSELLHENLRTRVLATRLLQRYGHLLPKIDLLSEAASELKARQLARERAAARETEPPENATPEQKINCASENSADCIAPEKAPARQIPRAVPVAPHANHDETLTAGEEMRTDAGQSQGAGIVPVSLPQGGAKGPTADAAATGKIGYPISADESTTVEASSAIPHGQDSRVF